MLNLRFVSMNDIENMKEKTPLLNQNNGGCMYEHLNQSI